MAKKTKKKKLSKNYVVKALQRLCNELDIGRPRIEDGMSVSFTFRNLVEKPTVIVHAHQECVVDSDDGSLLDEFTSR